MDMRIIGTNCPYCGELVEVQADPAEGAKQEFVQDCDVCCRPIRFVLVFAGGRVEVRTGREDEVF